MRPLSQSAAFALQASIVVAFLAGSSAPTPLYAVYQGAWGFSPISVTVVFGIYAVAVLAALLVAGSLSDYVGRRPVLFVAALVQAATMVIFATAHGLGALVAARILQGLATGAAASAVGAGMLDIDHAKGTVANAVAPPIGTGTGAIVSGLLVQFLPWPTQLIYAVFAVIFVAQAIGVLAMRETITPRPGALRALRPNLELPVSLRGAVWIAAPALVASWALAGFYGSLGPAVVRRIMGSGSIALGGLALFVLAAGGASTVLLSRTRSPRALLAYGAIALSAGVAITLVAVAMSSIALFFVGTAVAGSGFGASFQGAIRSVVPLAAPNERAGVLSVLYVISYLAMGLPAVLAGIGVVHGGGLLATARVYGFAVIALSALALVGTVVRRAKEAAPAMREPRVSRMLESER